MGIKRPHRESVSSSEEPDTPASLEQPVHVKIVHLDKEPAMAASPATLKCSLPPHDLLTFASFEEYEVHYQKTHVNRCTECHKNFPDERFLSLHIAEYHDPIIAAKREQGEKTQMCRLRYACLLPTCDRVCSTPQNRRLHCIDKHQFPRSYDFIIVKDGIDRRSSMLRSHRRRSSALSATGSGAATGRSRAESSASTAQDGMDMVGDEENGGHGQEDESQNAETKRYPTRLRGRGGFGRPTGGDGRGARPSTTPSRAVSSPTTTAPPVDPMDTLTAGMSALQFVPNSVRVARAKGRGRGG